MHNRSSFRLGMIGMLVIGMFISLVARLWYLQLVIENEFQDRAARNLERTIFIGAPRGRVLDTTGNVLIGNRLVNEVVIDKFTLQESLPSELDRRNFAVKLAREISGAGRLTKARDVEAALADVNYSAYDRVPIATDVPARFSILIGERENDFPGVRVRQTTIRHYPYGNLGSHLLGYVGQISQKELDLFASSPKMYQRNDEIGKQGVERALEDVLRGTPGVERIEVDANGNRVATIESTPPIPGNDVWLTIDVNLQALVERALDDGIAAARDPSRLDDSGDDDPKPFEAPGAAMVLLDPNGSKIRAMASFPTYDPQVFVRGITKDELTLLTAREDAPLINRATEAQYAPGSTFKPITAYAALDSGLLGTRGFLRRNQALVDRGIWKVPGECFGAGCTIENAGQKPLGEVDLGTAIAQSSNVFFGQLGYQFNVRSGFESRQLLDVARDFGYGTIPDAVYGAVAGSIPSPGTAGESANMAVGQGRMVATPLQIANSYAAIANGGKVYAPMLAETMHDPATGEVLIDYPIRLLNELYMPAPIYEPIIRGLAGVTVDEDGTAYGAFSGFPLERYAVLGKTGTVETPNKQDNSVFVAFGPWPSPEYVAVAYIEEAGLGGDAAAPVVADVFGRIADGLIDVVPTIAESEDLISESQAAAEIRLRTEQQALLEAQRQLAQGVDGGEFAVLIPGGGLEGANDSDGLAGSGPGVGASDEPGGGASESTPEGDNGSGDEVNRQGDVGVGA